MESAALGIAPGGTQGRGYLVPRKNRNNNEIEAVFDPGWRGLVDIARRGGEVKQIEAHPVYEVDHFEVVLGLEPSITHVPVIDAAERGAIVAAYAIAKFADGTPQFEVLNKADLDKIRNTSASKGGPWASWPEEMARKSAVRRLCKYLPYNPILERAIEAATAADAEDERAEAAPAIESDKKPRVKALAESLRAKAAGADASDEAASVVAAMDQHVDPETGEIGGES
jgi:recombination protein RecT